MDVVGLSSRKLKLFLDHFPYDAVVEDKYRGVDGTKVPREKWFNPDESQLPPILSKEKKVERRKYIEMRNREALEEREELGGGVFAKCCPAVRSNYNLEPKEMGGDE